MRSINYQISRLIELCQHNTLLHDIALEFEEAHSIKQREFNEANNNQVTETEHCIIVSDHMRTLLERVVTFACKCTEISRNLLTEQLRGNTCEYKCSDSIAECTSSNTVTEISNADEGMLSSVNVYEEVMLASISLMSTVLSEEHQYLHRLQKLLLEHDILLHIEQVFSTDFNNARHTFQDGFLTEHMRLLANLLYKNVEVANAVVTKQQLLTHILNSTKVDDSNPFMVEWAEFAIRNLCEVSSSARDFIRSVKLVKK